MTPKAEALLTELKANYKKAAFYASNYKRYHLPEITTEALSLPADSWNSGHDSRIYIPKGAKIRLVTSQETYELGIGGTDTDKLKGLWLSDFNYEQGDRTKIKIVKHLASCSSPGETTRLDLYLIDRGQGREVVHTCYIPQVIPQYICEGKITPCAVPEGLEERYIPYSPEIWVNS